MKTLLLVSLFFLSEQDSTKIDTTKVQVDSLLLLKQSAQMVQMYKVQATQLDSIKKKLNDPQIKKALRKKLKK